MWLGFVLRLLVAAWNGFFGPSFGAENDALNFHQVAVDFSQRLEPEAFEINFIYSYVLGVLYRVTTDALFWGSVVSCVAWLGSAHILMKIMGLLSFGKRQKCYAMLIFSLLPTSILWTSVTLREPYQLLIVNSAIYSSLRIHLNKSTTHWLWLFVAAAIGSILHAALFGFGLFLIVWTSFWIVLRKRQLWFVVSFIVVVPLAAVLVSYGLSWFQGAYPGYGVQNGFISALETYQRAGLSEEARTHYKDSVTLDGMMGLLAFIPVALFQYLFEPMPGRMSALVDVPFVLENLLRAVLIWTALVRLRKGPPHQRKAVLLVFVSFVVLETIWAVGTVNWGTAARHHISSGGLLVIAAFAYSRKRSSRRTKPEVVVGGLLPAA